MEDFIGGLIGLGIILVIIYFIVVYVIPIILGIVLAAGVIVGLFSALKSIVKAVIYTVGERIELDGYVSEGVRLSINNYYHEAPTLYYEDIAAKSYFFGPCFTDLGRIFASTFEFMGDALPTFGNVADGAIGNIIANIFAFTKLIFLYVFGTVCAIALLAAFTIVFLAFLLLFYIIIGICYLFEVTYRKIKRISFRCPTCKSSYTQPIYICPNCKIRHKSLQPGAFGIRKRKCKCGAMLPIAHNAKGMFTEIDRTDNSIIKTKFKFSEMECLCPSCGKIHNSGLSRPISIALIGGAAAGKTTFKIAFLNDFLNEELGKVGLDYEFADNATEKEFEDYENCYNGKKLISATNRGIDSDISTFSFKITGRKLDTDRYLQIYDMPGETFVSGIAKEGWNNFTFSEGVVFLLDPYSITEIKANCTDKIDAMGICDMDMNQLISSLVDTLRQVKAQTHKNRFTIPVALVINKVDTPRLRQMVGENAVSSLMENSGRFTEQYDAMDYICRCFLSEHGGDGFISNLDNNFENVHFFFASPMGAVPTFTRVRFHPVNVIPIMEWLLFRADSGLKNVFGGSLVKDITEEGKKTYMDKSDYDHYVRTNVVATK